MIYMINYNESVMKVLNSVAEKLEEYGFKTCITNSSENFIDWKLYYGYGKVLVGVDVLDILKGTKEKTLTGYADQLNREYVEPDQVPSNITELLKDEKWIKEHLTVRVLSQKESHNPEKISRDTKFEGIWSFLYLIIREEGDTVMGGYLTLETLKEAGISQDEAWEIAYKNVEAACEIESLSNVIARESKKYGADVAMASPASEMFEPELYVITNTSGSYGAASILNDATLRDFGERIDCRKLVAIPSSVHEFLLMRYSNLNAEWNLKNIIRTINEEDIIPEDRLGDTPYLIAIEPDAVRVSVLNTLKR